MKQTLDAYVEKLAGMPAEEQDALFDDANDILGDVPWIPNPGPQTEAYYTKADLLLYGGQGGGGKTDLIAGAALTQHKRSLLCRPQYTDLGAIIERVTKIAGTTVGLNSSPPAQFKYDDRVINFGGVSTLEKAETWQGNPHDLVALDEACQFLEAVVRFLLGWNRAADEMLGEVSQQKVRAILASNPPMSAVGEWVVGMFRPWLDVTHPNKAEHGELRWYITDPDGKDMEADGPDDVREFDGKTYIPKSRTFIPAELGDNPFLVDTGYQATLDAMPEPLRSAIRDGNFMAAREDDAMQVIPTEWVLLANERWLAKEKPNMAMSSIGLDVARGGKDDTVFAPRYGSWFDELTVVPGRQTPDGTSVAVLAAGLLRQGAVVGVDNIGIGADAETALKNAQLPFEAKNGSAAATGATRDGSFGFATYRSEMWWMFREALDPEYGHDVALPPDPALMADLTAPIWEPRPGTPPKIYVEGKKDIMKRLGRSPDRGDAIIYAWNTGALGVNNPMAVGANHAVGRTPAPATDYDELRH
jgi:hypothetical protein|tara:strand:+ start:593 stop:2182 length:1590 start_codon:yes stop_codon:yes gene_type:complete